MIDNETTPNVEPIDNQAKDTPNFGILTDEDVRALKFLNMGSQLSDIKSMISSFGNNDKAMLNMFQDGDSKSLDVNLFSDYLTEVLQKYTIDDIKQLSDKDINDIYTFNGKPVDMSLDIPDHKMIEFKRDYLVFRKEFETKTIEFNTEIEKIQNEIAENQKEFDNIVSKYHNIASVLEERLLKLIDTTDDIDKKTEYDVMYQYLRYAYTLENLREYMESYHGADILPAYKDRRRSARVYTKYKKLCMALNVKNDLNRFVGIEKNYLGDQYDKYNNIFLFSVMHMIGSWCNKSISAKAATLFVSQFNINIKNLVYDKFSSPEEKDEFINNIKSVLDIRFKSQDVN